MPLRYASADFEALRREASSWWHVARRKLLREAVAQACVGKHQPRVLDLGCAAEMGIFDSPYVQVLTAHSSLPALGFWRAAGTRDLACTALDELAFQSSSFDVAVAGDTLQTVMDDRAALNELRRVLKDGGMLCLTVPAYSFLWGDDDQAGGHRRRYTAAELRRKLNNCGFETTRVSYLVAAGFLPSMIERIFRNMFDKSAAPSRRTVRDSRFADAAMVMLLDCERHLIRYINLPFGTRLVCWARKPTLVAERVMVSAWERQWVQGPLPQGSSRVALPESAPAR
jgi:SAM-dependent methyltransferase